MNGYDRYLQQLETKESRGDKLSFSSAKKSAAAKSAAKAHAQAISKLNKETRPRKKNRVPVLSIVLSLLGLVSAYWGYENHEKLEKVMDSVEVSFMTRSAASETAAPAKAKSEGEAATAATNKEDKKSEEVTQDKVNNDEVVDFNYIKDFQERKKQLDMREEELKKLEAEMMVQKESVDKKLEEVENIRKQISQQLEERVKADEQKIDTLVQVYSQMKPQQAAKVFETIDEDLAVEVLTKMKKKSAADILNLLKADRAQSLSEKYAGYKRKPAAASMANSAAPKNDDLKKEQKNEVKP